MVSSNVRVTPETAAQLAAIPGVTAAVAVARDPVALIGSEKKSVYGIDVPSFQRAAFLPDVFFESGSASKDLAALAATPNGVLLARDQADKFNINVGDPVLMRLYNPRTAQYVQVKARAVGIYTAFPTSSQDSDFVLNRAFFTAATGTAGADLFLVRTPDPAGVAGRIQSTLGKALSLKVDTTLTATKVDESSLTSLNLGGLGRLEQFYTALIVAASLGIFLIAMLQTRRKEFGTMRALGGDERQLRTLVSAEAFTISGLSLLAGLGIGTGIASLFVTLLKVIFLIPPAGLTWPAGELGLLLPLALGGMGLGSWLANRHLAGLRVSEVLREA